MNKIYYKINELITEKSIITPDQIREILPLFIDYYKINYYLKDIEFIKSNDKGDSWYSRINRVIFMDLDKITEWSENFYTRNSKKIKNLNYNQLHLFFELTVLFHELRHAMQNKIRIATPKTKSDYLLGNIISECFSCLEDKYEEYYHLFPIEKDAEVFSYSTILKLFGNNRKVDNNLWNILINLYLIKIKNGYSLNLQENNLMYFYLEVLENPFLYEKYCKMSKCLNLSQKISFNFPLNRDERMKLNDFEDLVVNSEIKRKVLTRKLFID